MQTASIRAKTESFRLGVTAENCESLFAGWSIRHLRKMASDRVWWSKIQRSKEKLAKKSDISQQDISKNLRYIQDFVYCSMGENNTTVFNEMPATSKTHICQLKHLLHATVSPLEFSALHGVDSPIFY